MFELVQKAQVKAKLMAEELGMASLFKKHSTWNSNVITNHFANLVNALLESVNIVIVDFVTIQNTLRLLLRYMHHRS